jgi:hypothetical protein
VDAISDELLPLCQELDLDLDAVRQQELRGLNLAEWALGPIDEEDFRRHADAYQRRWAEGVLN